MISWKPIHSFLAAELYQLTHYIINYIYMYMYDDDDDENDGDVVRTMRPFTS